MKGEKQNDRRSGFLMIDKLIEELVRKQLREAHSARLANLTANRAACMSAPRPATSQRFARAAPPFGISR